MPSSRWMSLWDICPPWGTYVYTWHEHVHVLYMYVHTCGEHVWVSARLGFRPVDACLLWYYACTYTIFMVYSLVVQIPGMVWNLTTEVMKLTIYTVVNILDFYVISLFVSSLSLCPDTPLLVVPFLPLLRVSPMCWAVVVRCGSASTKASGPHSGRWCSTSTVCAHQRLLWSSFIVHVHSLFP